MSALWLLALLWGPAWGADAADLRAAHPDLEAVVHAAVPRPTRAGFLRFVDPDLATPEATAWVVARLAEGDDPPAVRLALADLAGRALAADGAWIAPLVASEADPAVRASLVAALRRAEAEIALPVLAAALDDPDPVVREEAARATGMHAAGASLASRLRPALHDPEAGVRATAAQALGWLGDVQARPALHAALADPDPLVRQRARGALERLQ